MEFLLGSVFLAIIAHGLIGASLVWDKILLRQPETKNLASYIFWLGAMSVLGVLLIPFGFTLPSAGMWGLGMATGVIELVANWFYYRALKYGEASQSLAVEGGFSPLATALFSFLLLSSPLGHASEVGFALMVLGGFVMFASERLNWRRVLPSVLISAVLFGLTNVLQKILFNETGFITGYVLFTIGTFLGAVGLLLRPLWRKQIFRQSESATPRSKMWYFVNRFVAGAGAFLIVFAVSRGSPAIVSAISGLRYAVVFVGAFLITKIKPQWLREDFRKPVFIGKSIATGLIIAGLALLASAPGGNSEAACEAECHPARGCQPRWPRLVERSASALATRRRFWQPAPL
ncbi:MAG: DMT family transporter [Bryobacterales bacterium]|nr:DMT family transporter [Bryobacterales bacterium]MBV9400345.1 DMT family transporter [Bryobacterales bacterium]